MRASIDGTLGRFLADCTRNPVTAGSCERLCYGCAGSFSRIVITRPSVKTIFPDAPPEKPTGSPFFAAASVIVILSPGCNVFLVQPARRRMPGLCVSRDQ